MKWSELFAFLESKGLGDTQVYAEHDVIYFDMDIDNITPDDLMTLDTQFGVFWTEDEGLMKYV